MVVVAAVALKVDTAPLGQAEPVAAVRVPLQARLVGLEGAIRVVALAVVVGLEVMAVGVTVVPEL
jgi:hypothetical protein